MSFISLPLRTPIGKFGGSLRRLSAPQLSSRLFSEIKVRDFLVDPTEPDWLFLGHARQAGAGPNPARQTVFGCGLSEKVPAMTLNLACASGLMSIVAAHEKILLGRAKKVYAGGVESMSNTPYYLMQARWGHRMGHGEVVDGMTKDGFHCPMADMPMGETVETYLAKELKISRADQDAYALDSQKRASAAWQAGFFKAECIEIPAEGKHGGLFTDEHLRADTTLDSLKKLPAVFDSKTGTITAGNSSGITDGAAGVVVTGSKRPDSVLEIIDYEVTALAPQKMGLGPVSAIQNLLSRNKKVVSDIEIFEINEAFAAQVLACNSKLKIPVEKLNPRGGAIALGHPIGATGTRIVVTLAHQLREKPGALGVASLCVSGGHGVAILFKAI